MIVSFTVSHRNKVSSNIFSIPTIPLIQSKHLSSSEGSHWTCLNFFCWLCEPQPWAPWIIAIWHFSTTRNECRHFQWHKIDTGSVTTTRRSLEIYHRITWPKTDRYGRKVLKRRVLEKIVVYRRKRFLSVWRLQYMLYIILKSSWIDQDLLVNNIVWRIQSSDLFLKRK